MTKLLLLGLGIMWMLRFVRSKQTCPKCDHVMRPERVQPWYLTWAPMGGSWQCSKCSHRWKN